MLSTYLTTKSRLVSGKQLSASTDIDNEANLLSKISCLLLLALFFIGITPTFAQDTDNDGIADTIDLDDDNDGIPDIDEGIQ